MHTSNSAQPDATLGRSAAGFTLLELLIVTALLALVASFAVPGLHSLLSYGRRATEINRLDNDLIYARSEAITRGQTITLCTSTDGDMCSTEHNWDGGWIVFVDEDENLKRDPDEALLRVKPAFTSSDRLVGNRLVAHHIGYQREGFLKGLHNGTITFSTVPDRRGLRRCLIISRTGRIRAVGAADKSCGGK
ncbi:MAG: GspH/FimT family pseudopilin [Gammaproteobacteria bacterium]